MGKRRKKNKNTSARKKQADKGENGRKFSPVKARGVFAGLIFGWKRKNSWPTLTRCCHVKLEISKNGVLW